MPPWINYRNVSTLLLRLSVALVSIELTLQCLAGFQHRRLIRRWRQQLSTNSSQADEHRVLCVGDSFTFGIGASSTDTSYPSQLQTLLNAQGSDAHWRVINFGKPGANSGEVLRFLPRWLRITHLCTCVC